MPLKTMADTQFIGLLLVYFCGVWATSCSGHFARSYNYFGYQHTDGRGIEPRSDDVDATNTIVSTCKRATTWPMT